MAGDLTGLTGAEAAAATRAGHANVVPAATSRSVAHILRANLLTPFNLLLGGLLVVILAVGPPQDALFGLVLVANAATGIVQELRARRALDRLAVLQAPVARVRRDGAARTLAVDQVVLGDVLELGPGDQVVVDGEVLATDGLEIDESLLTGESDPVAKRVGAELRSGSFVAAGSGAYRATRVGPDAYAAGLAGQARQFSLATSELRAGIDRVVKLVGWAMLPTATLLLVSQLRAHAALSGAISATVAGVVAMVPEGLVLLTTVAFALGAVRLARRHALVKELAAVETLARVDVLCTDKTGTLTRGEVSVDAVEPLAPPHGVDDDTPHRALDAMAAADPRPNATLLAVAALFDGSRPATNGGRWHATRTVPFSSARKWGGAEFGANGTWLLGAPEVLLQAAGPGTREIAAKVEAHAVRGRRVVLLASSDRPLAGERPPPLEPRALVVLSDQVRPEAPATLRWFAEQGVKVKVLSGDHPRTVAAVAARAGLDGADGAAAAALDARSLPTEEGALAAVMEAGAAFGRVTPAQKLAMVDALEHGGHTVAMTGDGVNDVLALKAADIGLAMGSGSPATRAVAQIVLLDSSFASLPAVVAEGRRVIANIERVAKLFLTKTVYSMLLALAVGVAGLPFPFLPRHLTLVGSLTIGIPAFFLALAPSTRRAAGAFVPTVLRFAAPAGVLAAAATFGGYALAYLGAAPGVSVAEARTTATLVLAGFGLVVLARLLRPVHGPKVLLLAGLSALAAAALLVPAARVFFALDPPPLPLFAAAAAIVAAAAALLALADRLAATLRRGRAAPA